MRAVRFGKTKHAFTMIEMMISIGLSSLVMLVVAGLQFYSARQIQQLYQQTRVRGESIQALDQLRNRLSNARCKDVANVTLSNSNKKISFSNPNLATPAASIEFRNHDTLPNTLALYYENAGKKQVLATAKRVLGPNGAVMVGVTGVTFQLYGTTVNNVLTKVLGVTATVDSYALLSKGQYQKDSRTITIQFRNLY